MGERVSGRVQLRVRPGLSERGADAAAHLGMALLALIMTAVSGYTTFMGMIRIVGADAPQDGIGSWLPLLVAGSITAVVQIGLTVLCWVAGRDLARAVTRKSDERLERAPLSASIGKIAAMMALLAICFTVSVFYSFNTYFNSMYSGKEERRVEAQAVPAVALQVSSLLSEAVLAERASSVDAIRTLASKGYFAELEGIAKAVAEAGTRIDQRNAQTRMHEVEAQKQRVAEEFDERVRLSKIQNEIDAANARLAEIGTETAALEESRAGNQARIEELRTSENTALDEAQKQLDGEAGRPAGPGKLYASAVEEATRAANDAAALESRLAAEADRMAFLASERIELEKAVSLLQVEVGADTGSQSSLNDDALPAGSDVIGGATNTLEKARIAFEQTPDRAAYDRLQSECDGLKALGKPDEEARAILDTASCKARPESFNAAVDAFTNAEVQRVLYSETCGALGGGLKPAKAVETLRECHFLALATGVDAQDRNAARAFEAIDAFASKFDRDQHPFLKTLQAFAIAPSLAMLALFLAAIQDVAVFIMTFMVEFFRRERQFARQEQRNGEIDAVEMQAIRHVLSRADPEPTRKNGYVFRLPPEKVAVMDTDELLAIKAVIEDLRGRGMIIPVSRSAYMISGAGFQLLTRRMRNARPRPDAAGDHTGRARSQAAPALAQGETLENVLALRIKT